MEHAVDLFKAAGKNARRSSTGVRRRWGAGVVGCRVSHGVFVVFN